MNRNLWTRDFSLLTLSTILSAIGGEAIMFPLSLWVFDGTGSPLLSAFILIAGFLPDILLGIFIAPLVERWNKKKIVIALDSISFLLYIFLGYYMLYHDFHYGIVLSFTLLTSFLSIIYNLAYHAWIPDIIPRGHEQKGNAVSSTIYPFITMAMAPFSAWGYKNFGIAKIFFFVATLLLLSIFLEAKISVSANINSPSKKAINASTSPFASYKKDLIEGIRYFQDVKGLRNIGVYMGITNGCSAGITQMTQYYFQTHVFLNIIMLGTLKTAQMLGRVVGGGLQYRYEIPPNKRFTFTKLVYFIYDGIDTFLLFLPYAAMLPLKFLTGGLGASSAIIRSTAYQNFLPREMRARVNSINSLLMACGMALSYLVSGILAEYLSFRKSAVILGLIQLLSLYFLIVKREKQNRPIYESDRTCSNLNV